MLNRIFQLLVVMSFLLSTTTSVAEEEIAVKIEEKLNSVVVGASQKPVSISVDNTGNMTITERVNEDENLSNSLIDSDEVLTNDANNSVVESAEVDNTDIGNSDVGNTELGNIDENKAEEGNTDADSFAAESTETGKSEENSTEAGSIETDSTEADSTETDSLVTEKTTESAAILPHNLSPWGMFMQADWVVKSVMIGLFLASLVTWTVLISKVRELRVLVSKQQYTLSIANNADNLQSAHAAIKKGQGNSELTQAATDELTLSSHVLADADGVKERVTSSLDRLEMQASRKVTRGTGILATIGSTAPFIGLFGTVWGIMNSFIGISKAQTTNLAVVAPGIAEALLATALGLVAAIPAVVIYNYFSRKISAYKAMVGDTSAAILRLVSRDLSHFSVNGKKPSTQE